MDDELMAIDGVIALPVPVPPILEQALGDTDRAQGTPAHFISMFGEPAGDEARCTDG